MKKLLYLLWIVPLFGFGQGKTISFQKNMKIFNGQESSYFIDTTSTSQDKNGQLTLNTLVTDSIYVGKKSMFDSTVSIGEWGYSLNHIILPESSSNTNAGLGLYGMVDYSNTAGKVFAGTYSRMLAMTTNQTNQSTMVGAETQFRLRDVDIADGVHAGLWAYAEQSGTSALTGGGTFDAISATVESEAGFSAGATEHVTGITIDGSINASATINASANFSGLYIKSNGKDWFDGIKITGCDNDIELQNGTTIDNAETDTVTITEGVLKVAGDMKVTGHVDYDDYCGFTYISTSGTQTIGTGGTFERLNEGNIAYTSDHLYNFTHDDGRLTYTGTPTIHVTITITLAIESGETAQICNFRIAKDGSTIAASNMPITFTATTTQRGVVLKWVDEVATNSYYEIFGTSDTNADEFDVLNAVFTITEH